MFHSQDFDIIIVGYVIMRLALVTQWLRAAKHDPERRITAYRYAIGIILVQIGWLVANFAHALSIPLFLLLVVIELFVPIYAEKYSPTPWTSSSYGRALCPSYYYRFRGIHRR